MVERDVVVRGYQGADVELTIYAPAARTADGPCILHIHGGGMVSGSRFDGVEQMLPWAAEHDAVLVTVEYRKAPEFPDPYPVEDCYAALEWLAQNYQELGIDHRRVLIAGGSAGGGLAAGVTLLARDRGGPTLCGQMLLCPMLDDRDNTISTGQFDGVGIWDRESNVTGWTALLGDRYATDDVSIYAAPSRARDLSRLPPTYLDVGSAEVFRDEDVAFATQIWADGGDAELHVWPGGTHGWEILAPNGAMAASAEQTRRGWIARTLAG